MDQRKLMDSASTITDMAKASVSNASILITEGKMCETELYLMKLFIIKISLFQEWR